MGVTFSLLSPLFPTVGDSVACDQQCFRVKTPSSELRKASRVNILHLIPLEGDHYELNSVENRRINTDSGLYARLSSGDSVFWSRIWRSENGYFGSRPGNLHTPDNYKYFIQVLGTCYYAYCAFVTQILLTEYLADVCVADKRNSD